MKIYVVAHQKAEATLPPDYEYIQVNAATSGKDIYPLKDNSGDNISVKNFSFCELTALYWIWKNDTSNDIVGLSHYRRFFAHSRLTSSTNDLLNAKDVCRLLKNNDFISSRPYKTSSTVYEHMTRDVSEHDIALLRGTIAEVCPDYLSSFDSVMQSRQTYLLNMIIGRKNEVDKYCQWLFDILFSLEPKIDMTGYTTQQKRVFGYMAERLQTVYLLHNNCHVVECVVYLYGVSKLSIAWDKLKRMPSIILSKFKN